MGKFHINYDDKTIEAVRILLPKRDKGEVTAQELIEIVFKLHELNLLQYEAGSAWEESHGDRDSYWKQKPSANMLVDRYNYTHAHIVKQLMRLLVIEFNITRFNFEGLGDATRFGRLLPDENSLKYVPFDRWLEESPYPKKITLIGNFIQSRPISSNLQQCTTVVDVEGVFLLDNFFGSKEIELPEKCILKNFRVLSNNSDETTTYADVKAYRNRESRLKRLAAQKEIRDLVKEANTSGKLTFTDNYGIPLERGCVVAFVNYACRIGKVLSQTSKNITVEELQGNRTFKVLPHELVRIA